MRALILEVFASREEEELVFRRSSDTVNAMLSERGWGLTPWVFIFSQVSVPANVAMYEYIAIVLQKWWMRHKQIYKKQTNLLKLNFHKSLLGWPTCSPPKTIIDDGNLQAA